MGHVSHHRHDCCVIRCGIWVDRNPEVQVAVRERVTRVSSADAFQAVEPMANFCILGAAFVSRLA